MTCDYSPYTLPTINFVGGETQDLEFSIYFYKGKKPYSLSFCEAEFAIVSLRNKVGEPILTKKMRAELNHAGTIDNLLCVTLDPGETVGLSGKYIYQIQIRDKNGDVEIPKQGLLYIINNIHKGFIQ